MSLVLATLRKESKSKVKVLVAQSCLTLCDLKDWILPGSSVHGILQGRIMGQVAIPFSRGSSRLRDQTHTSCIGTPVFCPRESYGQRNLAGHSLWGCRESDTTEATWQEVLKSRCLWRCVLFEGSRGESISFSFSACRGHPHSWAYAPLLCLQSVSL